MPLCSGFGEQPQTTEAVTAPTLRNGSYCKRRVGPGAANLPGGERAALEAHRLELARDRRPAEGAAIQAVAHPLYRVGGRAMLLPQLLQKLHLCEPQSCQLCSNGALRKSTTCCVYGLH